MSEEKRKAHVFGLGLDGQDGHKRLTRADDFTVVGGNAETHERMAETLIKTTEKLRVKGKTIASAEPKELKETLQSCTPDA